MVGLVALGGGVAAVVVLTRRRTPPAVTGIETVPWPSVPVAGPSPTTPPTPPAPPPTSTAAATPSPTPAPPSTPAPTVKAEPLGTSERLVLRSVRSLHERGSEARVAHIAEHLTSGGEVEVDEEGLRRLLDQLVAEGYIDAAGDEANRSYTLGTAGQEALSNLSGDEASLPAREPGAVTTAPPERHES